MLRLPLPFCARIAWRQPHCVAKITTFRHQKWYFGASKALKYMRIPHLSSNVQCGGGHMRSEQTVDIMQQIFWLEASACHGKMFRDWVSVPR